MHLTEIAVKYTSHIILMVYYHVGTSTIIINIIAIVLTIMPFTKLLKPLKFE